MTYDFLRDDVDLEEDEDVARENLEMATANRDPEDEDKPWAPEEWTLGPCGCTDYHMADCPTRTG